MLSGRADGAGSVDHVVDDDANLSLHLTDDLLGLNGVERRMTASLVDDGQVGAQLDGVAFGDLHPSGIRRNNGQITLQGPEVLDEDRHGGEMVDRPIKKALDLSRVEVHPDQAAGPGLLKQIGHQLGGDGLTA